MKAHYHEGLRCTSVLLTTLLSSAALAAAPVGYSIGVGAGYSDNIARTSTDEQSENMGTAELQLGISQNTRRLLADLAANLAYFEYFDNTYDSEVVGNLRGTATVRIVPERFNWLFEDNFGQVRSDPFAAVTPDNRENVNYFSTGPELFFRLASQTRLELSGQYSKVTYEDSELDSNRYGGQVSVLRTLSSASTVSLNLQQERIEYDVDVSGVDYDRQSAYLGYAIEGSRTRANVDLGYTRLKQQSNNDEDGLLLRLEASRRVSASSTLSARAGREFSDSGNAFRSEQGLSGGIEVVDLGTQGATQTLNPFISTYGGLGWDFTRRRTGWGVGAYYYDEDYRQQNALDAKRVLGTAYIYRDLSSNVRLSFGGDYSDNNYDDSVNDYREISTSAGVSWQLGSKLWLNLEYQRFDRSSDLVNGEYQENRGWLRLGYGTLSAGATSMPALGGPAVD